MKHTIRKTCLGTALAVAAAVGLAAPTHAAWEPTRPVEFIIPAGTGGGADIMARTIQGIVTKYNLMKQPMVVINKAGGAGGEGFLDVKASRGNPHKIIITLSNLLRRRWPPAFRSTGRTSRRSRCSRSTNSCSGSMPRSRTSR